MLILKHQRTGQKEIVNVDKCEKWAFKITKKDDKWHFEELYHVLAQKETRVGQISYGISYKKTLSKHLIHKLNGKFCLLKTIGKLTKNT